MFNLSEPGAAVWSTVPSWRACERCDELFAAAPGQSTCGDCDQGESCNVERCEAAHPQDTSACEGQPGAVRVVDEVGDELHGCVHHASVVLASVAGSRAYPGSVAGAAVEAFTRAQLREPFAFDPLGPWPAAHPGGGEG
jgi:hypothetical protein